MTLAVENSTKRFSLSSLLSAFEEKNENRSSSSSRSLPSANSTHFIPEWSERQVELFRQLQDEIQSLKYENNELKFLLFVALKHVDAQTKNTEGNEFQWEMENLARDYFEESNNTKNIQLELESATSMLEEAKWIQHHYEIRLREQELKIEELQLSLSDYPSSRCCRHGGNGNESKSHRIKSNGKQRSVSTSCQNRVSASKRCTKALLPDNYKETVATLPPILSGQPNNSDDNPFWIQRKKVA